ncbi:MAG: hypothetical protein EOO65_00030 [Methanosarcinales archaeon]|nr:MAG: hypothetical protein EOO65_00030 [Methanosarcinales archaeon]
MRAAHLFLLSVAVIALTILLPISAGHINSIVGAKCVTHLLQPRPKQWNITALSAVVPPPRAAEEKRVIAYSLFLGSSLPTAMERYVMALRARRHEGKEKFPRWRMRLYLEGKFSPDFATWLRNDGWEVLTLSTQAADTPAWFRMASRMRVADDNSVDRFIFRDLDSPLTLRDLLAVQYWIESDEAVLSLRDHAEHTVPMLGGMWGARRAHLAMLLGEPMSALLEHHLGTGVIRDDQEFLEVAVYPRVKYSMLVFDSHGSWCGGIFTPECNAFPTEQRHSPHNFVGMIGYTSERGPLTERCNVAPYDCSGMVADLAQMNLFTDQSLAETWKSSFARLHDVCMREGKVEASAISAPARRA